MKGHPNASGAKGGSQDMPRTKGGSIPKTIWPWMHVASPTIFTKGSRADCTQAHALIDGISAGNVLADRGYDTDTILEKTLQAPINQVIPPTCNRKNSRDNNLKDILFDICNKLICCY